MAKTKWWVVALVTVLVVVVLAAGGYALYRVGYAHGLQANITDRGLPQRFSDPLDRLDREGNPLGMIPRLQMREFGQRFMYLDRDLRRPALFPWRVIIPLAVATILVVLVVVLAVFLLTRRNAPQTVPSATPAPPQGQQPSEHRE